MTKKLLLILAAVLLGAVIAADVRVEPYVFEAGGAVCVFYEGQLECFCPCQNVGSCEQVPTVIHTPIVRPTPTMGVCITDGHARALQQGVGEWF